MLSRSQQKSLRKLTAKKQRWQQRLFIAEGRKVVGELLAEGLTPKFLVAEKAKGWAGTHTVELDYGEFSKWSQLEKSDEVLGVFPFPEPREELSDLILILDGIRDPGNLGTLLRTADWFGVNRVYCTAGTVDVFNPKAVQGSMGSIARVGVSYAPEQSIFDELEGYQFICADVMGTAVSEWERRKKTALILGSESHGPSEFWKAQSELITIPRGAGSKVESLNVAVAGAILMATLSGSDKG